MVSNPDAGHICEGQVKPIVLAEQVLNESKDHITKTGKRPRVAYREAMVEAERRFEGEDAENVAAAVGEFKRRKTSLYRAYNKKYPPIRTLEELRTCDILQESIEGIPWILRSDVQANLLLLASDHDIAVLHGSDLWVADGNFDYQPVGFAQLYTLHGFFATECKAAMHVLMPDRRQAMYAEIFTVVRQALLARHHSIGAIDGK